MAEITTSSFSSSGDKAVVSAVTESLCGVADDGFEDACSICLEPFGLQDPPTITSCNHEYHLHCILEWSQRSKECPICWQLFNLKDPAGQELLTAVEIERRYRKKDVFSPSPTTSRFREESVEQDGCFSADADSDSDADDRIMLHLAKMLSRAQYNRTRENQSLSGLGPSQVHVLESPADMSQQPNTASMAHHGSIHGPSNGGSSSSGSASTSSGAAFKVQVQLPFSAPFSGTSSASKADNDGEISSKPSVLSGQTLSDSLRRATPSEIFSFLKIKSKWSRTSARCKESISRSTLEIKEKLLSHNNSVNELSKGVKREMLAGISSIGRMIERLDLTPQSTPHSLMIPAQLVSLRDTVGELNAHNSILKATPDGSTSILDVSHAKRED